MIPAKFSVRDLFCFVSVFAVLLALNIAPKFEKGAVFATGHDPAGIFGPMHDTLLLRRGFPLHYQQSREWLEYRSVTSENAAEWQKSVGMRVTHMRWLVANVCFTLLIAVCVARATASSRRRAE